MSLLCVFTQVTLDDVYAHVARLGLDVDGFVAQTASIFEESSGSPETDFVRSISLSAAQLDEADVDPAWQTLSAQLQQSSLLAHPESPPWVGIDAMVRKAVRYAHVITPVGLRTLKVLMQKSSWDFRDMPSDELGSSGTQDQLHEALWTKLELTVGGKEYLAPAPEARALIVMARTVALVLSQPVAMRSDPRRRVKLVRADIYEDVVASMGLGEYFQVIRRILEIDHPEHIRVIGAWPSSSPERDIGMLEYRGQRKDSLRLNAAHLFER